MDNIAATSTAQNSEQGDTIEVEFLGNFNELWTTGTFASPGTMVRDGVTLQYAGQPARLNISFAPNDGPEIDSGLAPLIEQTEEQTEDHS